MPKHDNFLVDAIRPKDRTIGYLDGFRFGFGFFISGVFVALLLGGLSWGAFLLFKLL